MRRRARKGSLLEAAGCTGGAARLHCVSQRSAKERCRFVQEMHGNPNCARNTGQEEKGQPGARARKCSRVQEEEVVNAGEAQGGARCSQ